jgi:competence protein ComEC
MTRLRKKQIKKYFLAACIGSMLLFGVPALERATSTSLPPPTTEEMAVYFFDVGQGDAILAQSGDRQILIDGGPTALILEKLGGVMPTGDKTIELMVLTHPHADHITGLNEVLKRYHVNEVMATGAFSGSGASRLFNERLAEREIIPFNPKIGDKYTVGEMVYAVRYVRDKNEVAKKRGDDDGLNDSSIVGTLAFKNKRFLLMGDATSEVEKEMLASGADLRADVLKIGHHGSAYSTGEEFVNSVRPNYAVASLGRKNVYGFPAWRVTDLLKRLSVVFFRTDTDGTITFATDGESLQVATQKVK